MQSFNINGKKIGKEQPVLIVAEISANHAQNFKKAVSLIKKAKEAGADAVKFQAYSPDTMTIDANNKYFNIKHHKWGGQTLYQLYQKSHTPRHWFKKLKKVSDELGILFFATAFDKSSVDFLEDLNVSVHKIASFEMVDIPLIEYAAKTKKPLIISTGMGTLSEIKEAVNTARRAGAKDIILLKCVSNYPAKSENMNLKTIPYMKKLFGCPVGLSDHTLESGVSVAAVTLGACLVEKHFVLSRMDETPDAFFSIEPEELRLLVRNIRVAEKALGKIHLGMTADEKRNRVFRRSLFAVRDIKKGEMFSEENIRSIRPSNGLKPKYLKDVIGKKAKKTLRRGTPLSWSCICKS